MDWARWRPPAAEILHEVFKLTVLNMKPVHFDFVAFLSKPGCFDQWLGWKHVNAG